MSSQGKLTALLHELQHARSPLAQARILARAWRTVREISPTDRRLLARHLTVEGAEDILEALGGRNGGAASAAMLRRLAEARTSDGSTVPELVAALRDPERRSKALAMGADLAAGVLGEETVGEESDETSEVMVNTLAGDDAEVPGDIQAVPEPVEREDDQTDEVVSAEEPEVELEETSPAPDAQETPPQSENLSELPEPPLKSSPPAVDWSRWEPTEGRPSAEGASQSQLDAERTGWGVSGDRAWLAGTGTGEEGESILSRLLTLRRRFSDTEISESAELRDLVEQFPDGWARRRAVCALFEEGNAKRVVDALDLVSSLSRESDRRWCLGILADRGLLWGEPLERAVALLITRYSRKRLERLAGLAR